MTVDCTPEKSRDLASSASAFLRDFAAYAGRKGIVAAVFVALSAILEGLGLVLMVPLLGIVFGTGAVGRQLQYRADALFHLVRADSALGRLTLLLVIFGCLMVARAIVLSIRGVMLAELQISFVEEQRLHVEVLT